MEFMNDSCHSIVLNVQGPICEGDALTLSKSEGEAQSALDLLQGPG